MSNRKKNRGVRREFKRLLTTQEAQEIAYWHMMSSPFPEVVTRVPALLTKGLVPVDLWEITHDDAMIPNSSNFCSVMLEPDGYYGSNYVSGDTAQGTPVVRTGATFAGNATPVGTSTGVTFDSNKILDTAINDGMKYMLVTSSLGIWCQTKPTSSSWSGRVLEVRTRNPLESPIKGMTAADILTRSYEQGSDYEVREFIITNNGMFVETGLAVMHEDGRVSDENAVSALAIHTYPHTVAGYDWQTVAEADINQVSNPVVGYLCDGVPAGANFRVMWQSDYQTETTPSNRVTSRGPMVQTHPSDPSTLIQGLEVAQQVMHSVPAQSIAGAVAAHVQTAAANNINALVQDAKQGMSHLAPVVGNHIAQQIGDFISSTTKDASQAYNLAKPLGSYAYPGAKQHASRPNSGAMPGFGGTYIKKPKSLASILGQLFGAGKKQSGIVSNLLPYFGL